mmetsp:Transcript_24522/g.62087  ORF Transcript_24522/g.62087 Transcript_24522/m.62087 type:complete len:217 (-) Transcript_24522:197-847(-)
MAAAQRTASAEATASARWAGSTCFVLRDAHSAASTLLNSVEPGTKGGDASDSKPSPERCDARAASVTLPVRESTLVSVPSRASEWAADAAADGGAGKRMLKEVSASSSPVPPPSPAPPPPSIMTAGSRMASSAIAACSREKTTTQTPCNSAAMASANPAAHPRSAEPRSAPPSALILSLASAATVSARTLEPASSRGRRVADLGTAASAAGAVEEG